MSRHVKCSKCGHVGEESTFPTGRDFFQNPYVSACAVGCGNTQNPGDASMRGFGGERPFTFVEPPEPSGDGPVSTVLRRSGEAS